ncbi:MAG: metallophosphoesterase [Gammaproteobacteria bacterium]|nr:metallophosphoesterase [Gammaproteobacteria bacterium]
MKLYAISDLHLDHKINDDALEALPAFPQDWLIIGGDICCSVNCLQSALARLTRRFAQVLWVPGNHDLWTGVGGIKARGLAKYREMVSACRDFGVLTPEDPYPLWQGEGGKHYLAPLFLLYDYSFRPAHITLENAVAWAVETGIVCTDEYYLDPAPYASRQAWCQARCEYSEQRLHELPKNIPKILINHYPLREDLIRLSRIPRFSIWCGTRRTENWHLSFDASVVVSGHLHIRSTDYRNGVRFEEVSLGYPKNWDQSKGIQKYLRQILPARERFPA